MVRSMSKQSQMKHQQMFKLRLWNLEQTQFLVQHFCTEAEVRACAQERKVQKEFEIHRDDFRQVRLDVVVLNSFYRKFVGDNQRSLTIAECDRMFEEFGLQGVHTPQHVGEHGIDFADLLSILEQIRIDVESHAFDRMGASFEYFPKVHPHNKMLPISDLPDFLHSVGFKPVAQDELVAFKRSVEDVLSTSTHEDDLIDFDQIKRVLQRYMERLRRVHHSQEVNVAVANGFREDELKELHETFNVLDADGSGTIEPDEAWGAVKTLGFQISKAEFSAAYSQVDDDGSGGLEFMEFLNLLHLIRDREGCFATNRHISTLSELLKPELLQLLTHFHQYSHEVEALEHSELLMRVCGCFGAEPHDSVHKTIAHAKTFKDLCNAASDLFEKTMNGD